MGGGSPACAAAALALALAALALAACGGDGGSEPGPPAAPRTAEEREAAAVARRYVGALRRRDARAACRLLAGAAARAHRCASRPRIPPGLRARAAGGSIAVRHASPLAVELAADVLRERHAALALGLRAPRPEGPWRIHTVASGAAI